MRRFLPVLVLALLCGAGAAAAVAAAELSVEQTAVVRVVTEAYVDGIHNFRDPEAIRKGFHPAFEMLMLVDDKLEKLPIEAWIERIVAQNAKEAPPSRAAGVRSTEGRFPLVEVVGTVAFCKVEIHRGGKQVFTDFLSLYKFDDGWKIVGKTFYRHP